MGEDESIAPILDNLMESNKEMLASMDSLSSFAPPPDEQAVKENVIATPEVSATLSGDEKSRYRNIGQEMFSPILKSLNKILKRGNKKGPVPLPGAGGDKPKGTEGADGGMDINKLMNEIGLQNLNLTELLDLSGAIMKELMPFILLFGLGAFMLFQMAGDFFSGIWDWIKDFFAPLGDFFDFSNGPLAGVFEMIGGAISGLWKLVTGTFKALGAAGSWIWDGIKKIFTTFITGPNGILSFGTKLVKGIVSFASGAVKWIGDLLGNVILGPIKSIFGSAEESGTEAGEEIAANTEAKVDDTIHRQQVAANAVTNKAIMSQEEANKAWSDSVAKNREEARKQAEKYKLKVEKDGTISDDSIKTKMAEDFIKQIEEQNGKLKDDERAALMNTVKKNIEMNGNELKINGEKMKADVQKMAQHFENKLGSSDAVDALAEKVDTSLINGMNSQAKTLMELRAKANVENEFNAKTEEEKFLWRMEEAKKSGQLAEFRIAEARSMLITTTEQIKSSFREFKGIFENSFKNSFFDLLNKLTGIIKINFYPETIYDRSDNEYNISKITNNGTLYEIMPINKEDFAYTVNQLTTLAQASVDTLAKQNAVLGEIKELLAEGQPPVIMPPAEETKPVVPNESRHRMSMSLDNERKRSFSWFSSSIFGPVEASSGS